MRSCVFHESAALTRFIAVHGVMYARSHSLLGQNVLFCVRRYQCTINDVVYNTSANTIINAYFVNSVGEDALFCKLFVRIDYVER